MENKLERLLWYHRANVFDDNEAVADRHVRALRRLKRTATYRAMVKRRADDDAYRASERFLSMYA